MTDANEPAPKILNVPIGLDAAGMRREFDSLGTVEVPADRYWGAQTQRSLEHFNIGDDRMPKEVYHAYGHVKKAAAVVNTRAGRLPAWKGELTERVCDEVISGALDEQFPLYVFQTGSGTQSNMNVNEVISNRCIQLAGGTLGSQEPVHPNDHVNMGQSSNDTFPTAMHIAAYNMATGKTIPALRRLRDAIERNAKRWADVVKIGRTHLEDAVPLTVGQEWSGYTGALDDAIAEVEHATRGLLKLAMGGTAVGTGLNAPPGFGEQVAAEIASMTGAPYETTANKFAAQGTLDAMVRAHGGLKAAAVTLFKIANDLRWLGSGPRTGIHELIFPSNEPGSSIMPGKINPTQAEAMLMVAIQVVASDVAVTMGGAEGNFELNAFRPVLISNYLHSALIMADHAQAGPVLAGGRVRGDHHLRPGPHGAQPGQRAQAQRPVRAAGRRRLHTGLGHYGRPLRRRLHEPRPQLRARPRHREPVHLVGLSGRAGGRRRHCRGRGARAARAGQGPGGQRRGGNAARPKRLSLMTDRSGELEHAGEKAAAGTWRNEIVVCAELPRHNGLVASTESATSGMLPLRDTDPREVGAYRLLGRLGEGGQGVVFLAVSPTGSRAAVKLLPPTTDPRVRSRFLKEVAAAQRVARFCTAQVLDAGIFERRPFIASEYVSGPSLVEVVEQFGPRSGAALERIAVATLTALGAVHAVGMVHRDFKPGNVLLGPDGPVVIDFGLAVVPGMTTTGLSGQVAVGTPAFMAPEQLAAERVTAAADMWSWAVTIVFAGTGELPFRGESLTATAYAILHSEPALGRLPEPLGFLVHRCLSKDPAVRPSAREALSELVAAGAQLVGPLPPMASALATDEEPSGSPRASAAPPEQPNGTGDDPIGAGPGSRLRPARQGSGRPWWRRPATAVLAAILLVAGAGALAPMLLLRGASSQPSAGSPAGTGQGLGAEDAVRARAVTWILQQVSRAAVVSCDSQVCVDLTRKNFPSANLLTLGPESADPLNSDLVVATADIRAQYGARLASVYAPVIIASFGSGNARIDIRWVYPGGTAKYRAVQQADLRTRKATDAQLLTNSQLKLSAVARAQLLRGDIDPRLPLLIATMAHYHPVRIVDFVDQSPGGGPASLLRSVDFATTDKAAHLTHATYVGWMRTFIDAQRPPYRPAWSQQVTLRTGQAVLRIGYGAPSPLS